MEKDGWIERVDRVLSEQTHYTKNHNEEKLAKADRILCALLKEVQNSKDIGTILLVEHRILEKEKGLCLNSSEKIKRLDNALDAVRSIEECLKDISSPEKYKVIAQAYQLLSEQRNNLPYDKARKGFKHLEKHLETMNSMPVGRRETLTGIINNRRINTKEMEKLYIKKQKNVLGLDFTKDKKKSRGMER